MHGFDISTHDKKADSMKRRMITLVRGIIYVINTPGGILGGMLVVLTVGTLANRLVDLGTTINRALWPTTYDSWLTSAAVALFGYCTLYLLLLSVIYSYYRWAGERRCWTEFTARKGKMPVHTHFDWGVGFYSITVGSRRIATRFAPR